MLMMEKNLFFTTYRPIAKVSRGQTALGAPSLVFSPSARTCSLKRSYHYAHRSRARAEGENPARSSRPLLRNNPLSPLWNQLVAEETGLVSHPAFETLPVLVLGLGDLVLLIVHAIGDEAIDDPGEFMRGGDYRRRRAHSGAQPAEVSPERRLAAKQGLGGSYGALRRPSPS